MVEQVTTISREVYGDGSAFGAFHFLVMAESRPATPEHDVSIPVFADADGRIVGTHPKCPDCGGNIVWAEAGGVPGSRKCVGDGNHQWEGDGCGSRFVDAQYGIPLREHPAFEGD